MCEWSDLHRGAGAGLHFSQAAGLGRSPVTLTRPMLAPDAPATLVCVIRGSTLAAGFTITLELDMNPLFGRFAQSVLLVLLFITAVPKPLSGQSSRADSVAVARVVDHFHELLFRGDSSAALALLAPDVVIMESGDIERLSDYRAHHLLADIAFAKAVPSTRGTMTVTISGDAAWVSSTSTTQGTYKDRTINSAGAELVVVTRVAGVWRIRAIHWSSHARR